MYTFLKTRREKVLGDTSLPVPTTSISWIQGPESRKVRVRQLLACVGAPSDAKVPAGGDVDRLREITCLTVSSTAAVAIRTPGRASANRHHRRMALLQIHVVINKDHLAHPGVIAGHVGLPDVGQDDGGVVEESHSEHQPLSPLCRSPGLCPDVPTLSRS